VFLPIPFLGPATAILLSFPVALFAMPRMFRRPSAVGVALHVIGATFLFALAFGGRARPWFSGFVAVALIGLMTAVSNAKYASLREPFVFTDLSLFSQLFSHPRLYLPFLSIMTIVGAVICAGIFVASFVADTALTPRLSSSALMLAVLTLLFGYLLAARLPLTLDVTEDQRRHGFFAVFVAYLLNGLRPATVRAFRRAVGTGPFVEGTPNRKPDVIVIQSESFFDARRLSPAINASLLKNHDAARRESLQYGELTVPAWGANTMRTEFSLLTGLREVSLSYARFYPYAFLWRPCASLATWFKRAGYRTLAIHPYYGDFFGRDRAFKLLGFDHFIDITGFASAARSGPYIADSAVADSIVEHLEADKNRPAFIFSMTMENHGPLHLETAAPGESAAYHALGEDKQWRDLTVYLRHLANADAMVARLLAYLRARERDTVLCFYGDHVPALPHVFAGLNAQPARTDYFIWRSFGSAPAKTENLSVDDLGQAVLAAIDTGDSFAEPTSQLETTKK